MKRLEKSMETIRKLDFGQDSAESETQNLQHIFLSVPFYERLKDMEKWLVIGRKGSGKTAACLMAFRQLQRENKVTLLTPKSLSAAKSALLDKASINLQEAALQKWKFVFLLEISRYIINSSQEQFGKNYTVWAEPVKRLRAFLVEHDESNANQLDKAVKFVRGINKFAVSAFKVEGSIEIEKISESGGSLSDDLDQLFPSIEQACKLLKERTLYILVDQVDDLWDSTKEGQDLITGLLRAAKEINDSLSGSSKIIVFLRSDIFGYLRFHDSDKYRSQMETITWDTNNLKRLIALRIRQSTNLKGDVESLWASVFPKEITGIDSFQYLVSRTLMRPRDLIQLCNICRDKARDKNNITITEQNVMDALVQYSTWKLEDLVAEYSIQYPFLESLLLILFYSYSSSQLRRDEFEKIFAVQKKEFTEKYSDIYFEPIDVLMQILYAIGFLGVVHNGNVLYESRGDKFVLPYATDLEIHPAFRLGLKITDSPRNERTSIDPITLAMVATSLLAPFIKKAGADALDGLADQLPDTVGKGWIAISKKSDIITEVASDLAKNPDDTDNEVFFKKQLQKALEKDKDFANLLSNLLEKAKSDTMVIANNNSIAVGSILIGGNIGGNIVTGNKKNQVTNE